MDSSSELSPSDVRKIISSEHALLREKINSIELLIKSKNSADTVKLVQDMVNFFLNHIVNEEKILAPILKEIDAWGAVRAERLNKEHTMQREEVEKLLTLLKADKMPQSILAIEKFIKELIIDMEQEEKEFLNPDVLKDDPITVGSFSG